MSVRQEDIGSCTPETIDAVERGLAEKIERYAMAHYSPVFRLNTGHRVTSWALGASVLSKQVDYVDVAVSDPFKGSVETAQLPLETLLEVMGEEVVEDLGESFYLPTYEHAEEPELIARLKEAAAASVPLEESEPRFDSAEPESSPEESAQQVIQIVERIVVSVRTEEPEAVHQALIDDGLDETWANALMAAVSIAFQALNEGLEPAEVAERIQKELECPEDLTIAILEGIGRGLSGAE